eukprot:s1893_g8.t1
MSASLTRPSATNLANAAPPPALIVFVLQAQSTAETKSRRQHERRLAKLASRPHGQLRCRSLFAYVEIVCTGFAWNLSR